MSCSILVCDLSNEHYGEADDQLSYRTRVCVRGVKDRNAFFSRRLQVDLVYADTKRPDRKELVRRFKYVFCDLGL